MQMGRTATSPRIDGYRFGHIVVDGKAHSNDLIVLPSQVIEGWWRRQGHTLLPDDLADVFEAQPDLLIIGQGAFGRMSVPEQTRRAIESAGLEIIACPSGEACKTYNKLRLQRATALAIHLTC